MGNLANMKESLALRDGQCIHVKEDGTRCARPAAKTDSGGYLTLCSSHIVGAPPALKTGLYSHVLDSSLRQIEAEVINEGKYHDIRKPDLEDELALGRMLVMDMLEANQSNPSPALGRTVLRALDTIRKIAATAKAISEINANALNANFLESVMTAIVYAFERANGAVDPAERKLIFVRELASFFPDVGVTKQRQEDIVGEAVSID